MRFIPYSLLLILVCHCTTFTTSCAGGRHSIPPPRASGDSGRWHMNCWLRDKLHGDLNIQPKRPMTLTFDLSTLKVVSESRQTSDVHRRLMSPTLRAGHNNYAGSVASARPVARTVKTRRQTGRALLPSSIPLAAPHLTSHHLLFPCLPLEVGPLNPGRGSGERCNSHSGVWKSILVHFSVKIWHLVATILMIFTRID